MYYSAEKPIAKITVGPDFNFVVNLTTFIDFFLNIQKTNKKKIQKDAYGSFPDDQKQNWTILFKSTSECNQFAMYICIAKSAISGYKTKTLDIIAGSKSKVIFKKDNGDNLITFFFN